MTSPNVPNMTLDPFTGVMPPNVTLVVTILGCGSSVGVPALKYGWGDCDESNEKNIRTRSSIILETATTSVLVDMSPDLRQQLLRHRSFKVDGVIFTHEHYDHTSGINELRPVFFGSGRTLKIYSNAECIESIKSMFFYLFEDGVQEHNIHDPSNRVDEIDYAKEFSGNALYGSGDLTGNDRSANLYMPYISANIIADRFQIGDISGICFEQNHGHSKSMGIRVGNFAYTTDVVAFPEESFAKLYGLDVWVVDCLSPEVVSNHANIDSVLRWVEILKPKMTYLTHMSIRMDYDRLLQILPPNVRPAYDQMQFEVNNQ